MSGGTFRPAAKEVTPGGAGPRIEVRIDELVLYGFPAAQGQAIRDHLEQELAVELERQRAAGRGLERVAEAIDLGSVTLGAAPKPAVTGRQLARALAGGLRR